MNARSLINTVVESPEYVMGRPKAPRSDKEIAGEFTAHDTFTGEVFWYLQVRVLAPTSTSDPVFFSGEVTDPNKAAFNQLRLKFRSIEGLRRSLARKGLEDFFNANLRDKLMAELNNYQDHERVFMGSYPHTDKTIKVGWDARPALEPFRWTNAGSPARLAHFLGYRKDGDILVKVDCKREGLRGNNHNHNYQYDYYLLLSPAEFEEFNRKLAILGRKYVSNVLGDNEI